MTVAAETLVIPVKQPPPIPTFEDFAGFMRDFADLSDKTPLVPSTQFENDLGITGDDGVDLLRQTERHFCVALSTEVDGYRKTFRLAANEYLFHSEGLDLFGLCSGSVRQFTVGELYDAVCRSLSHESKSRV